MTKRIACNFLAYQRYLHGVLISYIGAVLVLIALIVPFRGYAQQEDAYDEVSVFFNVPRVGGADIPAVIKDEVLYLPVTDVFDFLKIKNTLSPGRDSITGFFLNPESSYLIDRLHSQIVYQGKVFELKPEDIIRTETNLYLKSNYFGQVFGLECTFSFRSLSVALNTKIELPIIREMRQEQMRKNISQLKGEIKADTTIERSYPLFHFGMADWSAISSQQVQGKTDTRLMLTLGGILAGGETNVTLNYNNNTPFTEKQQFYLWRYVNNDHKALRQVLAGKIASGATASLYSPLVGVQFTNAPTTYRRSFGSYTLTDVTEPGWMVELYVNNVLVDYVKADARGFFTFQVPLVYGSSGVKLQFYGPWGEEKSKEQNISIPFNFLPVGEFEYKVSAGMVEDDKNSRFSRGAFNYGLTRRITVGGGLEYLSTVTSGSSMPFVNTSIRLASSLLISSEYAYGVRSKSILSYRLPSNVQFEVNYTKYDKGQTAINNNYLEERKFAVSVPIRAKNFAAFSRLTINQIILPRTKYTTAELLLSGSILGVSTNFTTYSLLSDLVNPYTYSNLALSFKIPGAIIVTPQAQFEYNRAQFVSAKMGLEKHLFKHGFMNLSYEQNMVSHFNNIELGFRYEFAFAQAGFSARRGNNITTMVESASGSIIVDAKTHYVGTNNRSSVGKGGITLLPYLDLNCNGRREPNEPRAFGLNLHINGGRVTYNDKDTTIRVFDLEPYTNYLVTLDGTNFDNIAWQMRKNTISVAIDPNMFKLIEVPIAVMGEAAGTVYMVGSGGQKGQGRIIVDFYGRDSSLFARTLTEADGYFSFLGLPPGEYDARVDASQLEKLNMSATPAFTHISIEAGRDGDVVDGLEFVLRPFNQPAIQVEPVPLFAEKVPVIKDSIIYMNTDTLYKVQLLALRNPIKVKDYFTKLLEDVPGLTILETLGEDGLYHYSTEGFKGKVEARKLQRIIKNDGWKDSFVAEYAGEGRMENTFRLKLIKSGSKPVQRVPAKQILADGRKIEVPGTVVRAPEVFMPKLVEKIAVEQDTMAFMMGDTLYQVQLLALRHPIKVKDYFKQLLADVPGLTITETLGEDGLYHYSTGAFSNMKDAREFLRIIRKSGWKDCFIAIYVRDRSHIVQFRIKGGTTATKPEQKVQPTKAEQQAIHALEAQKIAKPEPVTHLKEKISVVRDTVDVVKGDTLYKVQLLSLSVPIRVKGYFLRLLNDVPGLTIEEKVGEDGMYHYSTGAFKGMVEAREFLRIIKESGWKDCFIATYSAGKRNEPVYRLRREKGRH